MDQLSIIIVVILFLLIEADKKIYKRLDDDYKRFILKDKYNETQAYYNSNSVVQFIKNIENHTKGRDIYKVIGFVALLLFIFLYNKIDKSYSTMILKTVGILISYVLVILCVYNLINGLKQVNEYKKKFEKNTSLEILYVALHSSYFLIVIIFFYIERVIL